MADMSLYWLEQTLVALPLALWIYFGTGMPFALLLLPRSDWKQRPLLIALSFALGSALLTSWMLILGWIGGAQEQPLLRFDLVFGGTVLPAIIGAALVWQKLRTTRAESVQHEPLAFDEKLLIALIILALILRWFVTAYWPFTAYDSLWVYGYEGRLYTMLGYIPGNIGYYPQFIPLQYTFMQLIGGGFDDHAARVIVPFLHLGSILAAYSLGVKLFNRRTGIFIAAIWAFYPHMAQWAHIGDLEIPMTFLFTLTALFFLSAWTAETVFLRRRYALLSGILFGIAMWTKPTAGAFIWGVILLVIVEFVRVGFDWRRWLPRFEVALITGLACIPLGSVWYLRNISLGLPALVFPHESWLTRATRSGDLLSWPLFALFLLLAYLASTRKLHRGYLIIVGVLLILVGAMPSSPLFNEVRRDPPLSYLTLGEALAILVGLGLIFWQLRHVIHDKVQPMLEKIVWAYLLALPYFITWFWSYSYHARLSFTIVPILILPIAVILAQWLPSAKVKQWQGIKQFVWGSGLVLMTISGMITPLTQTASSYDWLWTDRYPDDLSRTQLQNPGVALTAQYLWGFETEHGRPPVVIAPGEQRLQFFLPYATIITDSVPTSYEELEGVDYFVYGSHARWRYADEHIAPEDNRVVSSLGREDVMTQVLDFEDGTFEYELYQLHLQDRYLPPEQSSVGYLIDDLVIFGNAIRYWGHDLSTLQLAGNTEFYEFLWEVLAPLEADYFVRISLFNIEDEQVYHTWEFSVSPNEKTYYSTQLWEVGEFVIEQDIIQLNVGELDLPHGAGIYKLVLDFVNQETDETLPVTVDGEPIEGGYPFPQSFSVGR
jgi:4-amino-4-deoxy-L-arabinose transferase-like glycosyltransferase